MATKLKEISRSMLLKIIAFIIMIVSVLGILFTIFAIKDVRYFEALTTESFTGSMEHAKIYVDSIGNIMSALTWKGYSRQYDKSLDYFTKNSGIYYNATDGIDTVKNTSKNAQDFFSFTSYVHINDEKIELSPNNPKFSSYIETAFKRAYADNSNYKYDIGVGLSDTFLQNITRQWDYDRQTLLGLVKMGIISLFGMWFSFIYLVFVTGRKGSDEEVHLSFIDKLLFTDLNMVIIAVPIYLGIETVIDYPKIEYYQKNQSILLIISVFTVIAFLVLSIIRHIKNKSFVKHSLIYIVSSIIYKVFYSIYKFFMELFFSGPLMIKAIIVLSLFTVASVLGLIFFPLIIIVFLAAVYLVFIYVKRFNLIKHIVQNVKSGDIENSISAEIKGKGELSMLANDINSIAEGLDKAVKNEVKSQRMKSELISNVSHDIKTPLTSIINYVDLLKKEGMGSENASKYLDILEQKSQRLKVLTEDLFEAAKASSGDMPIELEMLDIFSLIQQGLAELDDRIEESGLHFKVNIPEEKTYVMADGRLLWRVIENLLSNVFKYALKGSRVYINVINSKSSNEISLVIKNISSYELNVEVDELMERFKRADESRSSEGSGLGLAIAKDLMEMQKGSLNLEIDGDLFKAIVNIPKCEPEPLEDVVEAEIV